MEILSIFLCHNIHIAHECIVVYFFRREILTPYKNIFLLLPAAFTVFHGSHWFLCYCSHCCCSAAAPSAAAFTVSTALIVFPFTALIAAALLLPTVLCCHCRCFYRSHWCKKTAPSLIFGGSRSQNFSGRVLVPTATAEHATFPRDIIRL